MIQVLPYNENAHYEMISEWYYRHHEPCPSRDMFPYTGFIVPNIAAGFLYRTDSKISLIENLITNPTSDKIERNEALDAIVKRILREARNQGLKIVIGTTKVKAIVKRAEKHGFRVLPEQYQIVSRRV